MKDKDDGNPFRNFVPDALQTLWGIARGVLIVGVFVILSVAVRACVRGS